jgi:hypothetical protein
MRLGKFIKRVVSDELKSGRMYQIENVINKLVDELEEKWVFFGLFYNSIATAVAMKRKKFDLDQMYEIILAVYEGFDFPKLLLLIDPTLSARKMEMVRLALRAGLSEEQIKFALQHEDLDEFQLRQVLLGFKQGLTEDEISVYAKTEFDYTQMHEIRLGFVRKLDVEKIKEYANPEYTRIQMRAIRAGYMLGWEKEKSLEVINQIILLTSMGHAGYEVLLNEELLDHDEDGKFDEVFASFMLGFTEEKYQDVRAN